MPPLSSSAATHSAAEGSSTFWKAALPRAPAQSNAFCPSAAAPPSRRSDIGRRGDASVRLLAGQGGVLAQQHFTMQACAMFTTRAYQLDRSSLGGWKDAQRSQQRNVRFAATAPKQQRSAGPAARPPPPAPSKQRGRQQEQPPPLNLELEEGSEQSNSLRGACYGCGALLQLVDPEAAGYVEQERYELKRRHRQLGQLLCRRCQALSNGAMIPAVEDFAQRLRAATAAGAGAGAGAAAAGAAADAAQAAEEDVAAEAAGPSGSSPGGTSASSGGSGSASVSLGFEGKRLLSPEALRSQLAVVREAPALVVLLVDLLDVPGSLLGSRLRDLVGSNPIMLVGTKLDLLPRGTDPAAVMEWLAAAAAFRKLNMAGVRLASSRSGQGVAEAAAILRRERRGRDVYVVGAANVGKSAFIRALVKEMSSMSSRQYDPAAAQHGRYLPVESAMPGTTLQLIPMEVFGTGGVLYDTPGLHLHHRLPHLLDPEENKVLHPRRRLAAYLAPPPAELAEQAAELADGAHVAAESAAVAVALHGSSSSSGSSRSGGAGQQERTLASYWWGGLARIDVLACPESTQLVFYGPPALRVTSSAGGGEEAGAGGGASPEAAFGAASVAARGGLRPAKDITLPLGGSSPKPLADVAVSGLPGWLAVYAGGRPRGAPLRLRVWAPVGVEVFQRPPLPMASPFGDD